MKGCALICGWLFSALIHVHLVAALCQIHGRQAAGRTSTNYHCVWRGAGRTSLQGLWLASDAGRLGLWPASTDDTLGTMSDRVDESFMTKRPHCELCVIAEVGWASGGHSAVGRSLPNADDHPRLLADRDSTINQYKNYKISLSIDKQECWLR